MKLSITQMVLSILIIFAACYVTGWMMHEAPSQLKQPIVNESSEVTYIDVVPEDEALFNISRYGSYFLPVLGVLVLIIGTIQSVKTGARNRRLITINIIAGVLVTALALIITRWGFPTSFHAAPGGGSDILINTNPGRSFLGLQSASGLMVLVGLAVCGCGIAQLVKSRKAQTI